MTEDVPDEDKVPDPRITGQVRQSFLIIDSNKFFEPLLSLAKKRNPHEESLALATSGLESIVSTATLPLTLVQASICQHEFNRLLMQERIKLIPAYNETSPYTPEQRENMALEIANREMTNFLASVAGKRFLRNEIVHELWRRLQSSEVSTASRELLVQSLGSGPIDHPLAA